MTNPVIDQERVAYLRARAAGTPRALLPAWPRSQRELARVDLEVGWVRFSTLNHRTKAEQLRAAHQKAAPDLFTADPMGPSAQMAQYEILKSQDGFDALKSDLKERRQQEPAVVTAEGVLINGNRRAAALRSLYQDDHCLDAQYISCLILPEDATPDEIVGLETELQIARDFKEAYSWVNEAMLIEELYERDGRDFDRVAARMHREAKEIKALHEKLQQVNQLVALSGGAYLHVDFTENESAFDELATHIRNKSHEEAESVRAAYYLGTLAGVNYRELRHLRRPDASTLIIEELHADKALEPLLKTLKKHPVRGEIGSDPLDEVLGGPAVGNEVMDLLGLLATKRPDQVVELDNGEKVPVKEIQDALRGKISAAAIEASEESRDQKAIDAPLNRLDSALEYIQRAAAALGRARGFKEWSEDAFQVKVAEIRKALASVETRR